VDGALGGRGHRPDRRLLGDEAVEDAQVGGALLLLFFFFLFVFARLRLFGLLLVGGLVVGHRGSALLRGLVLVVVSPRVGNRSLLVVGEPIARALLIVRCHESSGR